MLQAYLGNTAGSILNQRVKSVSQRETHEFIGFLVHIKVMLMLYHHLLGVQYHYV